MRTELCPALEPLLGASKATGEKPLSSSPRLLLLLVATVLALNPSITLPPAASAEDEDEDEEGKEGIKAAPTPIRPLDASSALRSGSTSLSSSSTVFPIPT